MWRNEALLPEYPRPTRALAFPDVEEVRLLTAVCLAPIWALAHRPWDRLPGKDT